MSKKKELIQMPRGSVVDLISHIKDLPMREKGPDEMLKLSDLFKMKNFLIEAKSLLERGYSAQDLARLVSKKCGADVSARRIKYFITYSSNSNNKKRKKRPSSPKLPDKGGDKSNKTSHDLAEKKTDSKAKLQAKAPNLTGMCTTSPANVEQANPSEDGVLPAKEVQKAGTFVVDMQIDEI